MTRYSMPQRLDNPRAWRTYLGGSVVSALHGETGEDGHFPEEWIMSVVSARNAGREQFADEGLSHESGMDSPPARGKAPSCGRLSLPARPVCRSVGKPSGLRVRRQPREAGSAGGQLKGGQPLRFGGPEQRAGCDEP